MLMGSCYANEQEIENLDSLKALEQLWLGKNKITELKAGCVPSLPAFLWFYTIILSPSTCT